ncbi:MAG: hypothetical protein RLZZ453_925 [Chlamydiota bacterium]|jgi:hypothetical protein
MNYKLFALVPVLGISLGFWSFHHRSAAPLAVATAPLAAAPVSTPETTPSSYDAHTPFFNPNLMEHTHRVWVNTEMLFWQSSIGSLSYGTDSGSVDSIQNGHVKSPHFDYNFGYRLGVGYKIPHDQWDLFANYTYLYGSAHGKSQNTILFPTWATNFANETPFYATSSSANWTMHLNMADLELGRVCLASRFLSLRPFIGLRGGTIAQRYTVKYEGGTVAPSDTDQVKLNADFWGVGLRMGLNTLWGLGKGLSLYGNGSASMLSSHFNVYEKEKLIQQAFRKMNIEATTNNVIVEADVALGLQWDYLFSQDRYHIGLKLGWEFDVYFDQNRLFNFASSDPGSLIFQKDDLAFQGLTIGFRFDF